MIAPAYAPAFHLLGAARGHATSSRPPVVNTHWLTTDRQIFRQSTGAPWRYCGISAFPLLDRFARGDDVAGWLANFPGYNVVRVWPYVGSGWGDAAWDVTDHDVILEAIDWCASIGWYVELTLLTDDDPQRLPWAADLVERLAAAYCPNLLIEIGNEPLTNKQIDVQSLRDICAASGYVYSSGIYEVESLAFGTYGTAHTPRDYTWARKAHDLLEYYNGGGPHAPHAGCPWPWVADEPIRPDQTQNEFTMLDYRGYGAVCSLLGAGATFHFEGGKHLHPPTELELAAARELLTGLLAYPADAPLGAYNRITEPNANPDTSRCYTVGPWMARVRPPQPTPPAGYVALDPDGVICRAV